MQVKYMLLLLSLLIAFVASASDQAVDENATDQWDVNNPPGIKQMVDIKTSTGTWMNVDVSPDGRLYESASMNQVFPEKVQRAKFYFE